MWLLLVDPDDPERLYAEAGQLLPIFADEQATREEAVAEGLRVLQHQDEVEGEHDWHAICYQRVADPVECGAHLRPAVEFRLSHSTAASAGRCNRT